MVDETEIDTQVITLADVRSDVAGVSAKLGELTSLVRESNARSEQRLKQVEDQNADQETRIRVLDKNSATRVELETLRAQMDARHEAARNQEAAERADAKNRMPAWLSVLIAACSLLLTLGGVVTAIALAINHG